MELKVKDVARRLNVSEKTVYKWLNEGTISGKSCLLSTSPSPRDYA